MESYIAFLRGINVSGQKIIKMEKLRSVLADAGGFANIRTYIQSGNLLFDHMEENHELLILKLEDLIETSFGFRTDVILRTRSEIENIVKLPLFESFQSDDTRKYYITFLKTMPVQEILIPLSSKNKDVEIFRQDGVDLFSICTLYKGNYGFPNAFIEKLTGIPATTRNPITLRKILEIQK